MLLNISDISNEPLQAQIIRQIRAKILSGDLAAETELPSIRGLARDHHISVITVQRAYETLEHEDLIHSRRGKGFFVSTISEKVKRETALKRLEENAGPQIQSAIEEGLSKEDVRKAVERLLE